MAIKMRGDWAHFIHESLMQVGVDAVNPYLLEDFSRNYEILFNDDFLPYIGIYRYCRVRYLCHVQNKIIHRDEESWNILWLHNGSNRRSS